MPKRAARTALMFLLLLAGSSPTPARALTGLSNVAEETLSGSGWRAYRFTVATTAAVRFEVSSSYEDAGAAGLGAWLLRGNSVLESSFIVDRDRFGEVLCVHLVGTTVVNQTGGGGAGDRTVAIERIVPAGTYYAVAVAVTDGTLQGTVRIDGGGTLMLRARSGGTQVFHDTERDFGGVALQYAPGVRAHAIADGATAHTIEHTLFGWFGTIVDPASRLHVHAGSELAEGLTIYTFGGAPAERYVFHIDAAGSGPGSLAGAFGADVTLP